MIGRISDVCKSIYSGGTPNKKHDEYYYDGNIPWLNTSEIRFNRIYATEKFITDAGLLASSAKWVPADAVIVAMYGATAARTAITKIPLTTNQACCNLIVDVTKADYRYVYYWLCFKYFELASLANGGAQQNLNAGQIKEFPIIIPQIDIQKKIAEMLSVLDDKIENNNRINDNLSEQAHAIFQSWFIDYVPFDGLAPSNWIKTTLGEVCSCELGGTPSRTKPEYWNGNIPWINSGEVNLFRITKPSEMITELGLSKSATKLLPAKTTVIAITGATLGQISLLEIESCANQSVVGVIPNERLPYEFIYPYISSNIQELISHQTGGAQQHINKQNVEGLPIVVPSDDIMNEYVNLVHGYYSSIANNCFENERLAELRDALLPRLMSGELDVSDLDL